MTNKELDDYIKKINPNFDSHIEKETIEMSNEYYNLLEEKMARLINENQELKQKYLNAVADYETTIAEKEQLNSLVNSCQEEIRQLKKQVEDAEEELECVRCDLHNRTFERDGREREINGYKTQQKEFILYLRHLSNWYSADGVKQGMVNEILQKCKEMLGDDK